VKSIYYIIILIATGCSSAIDTSTAYEEIDLSSYWYTGQGEVNVYDLEMNRYNGIHPGEAVLIQVSEDFLLDAQVKSDQGQTENSIPVIKTNLIERFSTGIYDYSVMTSCFTQASQANHTIKITSSSQDWCGQTFVQANYEAGDHVVKSFSYFQTEGDQEKKVDAELLEDEIFNLIRINPENIPTGKVSILPSMRMIRNMHLPIAPVEAHIKMKEKDGQMVLDMTMLSLDRKKSITFQKEAPHYILQWEDSYPSAFDHQVRTTKATLRSRHMLDYWNLNKPINNIMRDSIQVIKY